MMKLKERVALVAFGSCFILLFFKYKASRQRNTMAIDYLVSEENEDQRERFHLEISHAHKRNSFKEIMDDKELIKADDVNNILSDNDKQNLEEDNTNLLKEDIHPWDIWWSMVTERYVTTPENINNMNKVLKALATAPIVGATTGTGGTQLKVALELEGPENQKVVFKPKRYSRQHVIQGKVYDGFDRHNGEIAAFHLDRILGFYRAPPVVGRRIDLEKEMKPVVKKKLWKTVFTNENGDVCFYGVCYYCKKSEAACADGQIMEGSVTIWLPAGWELKNNRHPWQRTYKKNKKARWERDPKYCLDIMKVPPYDSGPRLLDIMDTAIFDFLIGNGDRHHYETFKKGGSNGMLLHLDNAKSFGNYEHDEMSILVPILQCCRIRKSTFERLRKIPNNSSSPDSLSSRLRKSLLTDPISPVLDEKHLFALDRRLKIALGTIDNCIRKGSKRDVIIEDNI